MPIAIRVDERGRTVYREVEAAPNRMQQVFRRGFITFMTALKKRANHEILHGKKTGRVYWYYGTWASRRIRGSRRRRHQASAAGETHANLTGRLRRSLSWRVNGWERAEFGYGVSTDKGDRAPRYAPWVEFGTKHAGFGQKMAPRPTLKNAILKEEAEPHFRRAFDAEFG